MNIELRTSNLEQRHNTDSPGILPGLQCRLTSFDGHEAAEGFAEILDTQPSIRES
jgi:hypothetical protein